MIDVNLSRVDQPFKSCVELETYIAEHYPHCERWVPPPPIPEDAAKLEQMFGIIEKLPPDQFNPQALRPFLVAQLYQSQYPPETVERIRRVLGLGMRQSERKCTMVCVAYPAKSTTNEKKGQDMKITMRLLVLLFGVLTRGHDGLFCSLG